MLDTDVAIHLRDREPRVTARVSGLETPIVMSVISRVELEGGVYAQRANSPIRRSRLDAMLEAIEVLPFDSRSADAYRSIVASAGYSRRKVFDRMIAAQALVNQATLVTLNGDDFRDIPGLQLLEW